jgi:hypothetical protein
MSGLFSSPPPPPMPKSHKPPPMPDPESPAVREARRQAALDMLQRAGRDSTIRSSADNRGAADYSRTTLGSR